MKPSTKLSVRPSAKPTKEGKGKGGKGSKKVEEGHDEESIKTLDVTPQKSISKTQFKVTIILQYCITIRRR